MCGHFCAQLYIKNNYLKVLLKIKGGVQIEASFSALTHILTQYRKNVGAPVGQNGLNFARVCEYSVQSAPLQSIHGISEETLS